jgi:hypothetical protein
MNHYTNSKIKTFILIALGLILVGGGIGVYVKRSWVQRHYEAYQLKRELSQQIQPLRGSLEALGFTDLKLKSECSYPPADYQSGQPGKVLHCTASISKYIIVGSGSDVTFTLTGGAVQLSKQLDQHGWQQRKDLPTIKWFEAIAKGVDYQPDQLNVKQLDDATCTIDFFTAFSKPAKPAINLVAMCQKPKFNFDI